MGETEKTIRSFYEFFFSLFCCVPSLSGLPAEKSAGGDLIWGAGACKLVVIRNKPKGLEGMNVMDRRMGAATAQLEKLASWLESSVGYVLRLADIDWVDESQVVVELPGGEDGVAIVLADDDMPLVYDGIDEQYVCFGWPDVFHMLERLMREEEGEYL